MNKIIEFTSNPTKSFGIYYVPNVWFLRSKPNAMLTFGLLFFVVWIKLPWPHVMDKNYGKTVAGWGFSVRLSPFKFQYQIKYKLRYFSVANHNGQV